MLEKSETCCIKFRSTVLLGLFTNITVAVWIDHPCWDDHMTLLAYDITDKEARVAGFCCRCVWWSIVKQRNVLCVAVWIHHACWLITWCHHYILQHHGWSFQYGHSVLSLSACPVDHYMRNSLPYCFYVINFRLFLYKLTYV